MDHPIIRQAREFLVDFQVEDFWPTWLETFLNQTHSLHASMKWRWPFLWLVDLAPKNFFPRQTLVSTQQSLDPWIGNRICGGFFLFPNMFFGEKSVTLKNKSIICTDMNLKLASKSGFQIPLSLQIARGPNSKQLSKRCPKNGKKQKQQQPW